MMQNENAASSLIHAQIFGQSIHAPILVDLDLNSSEVSPPGTISAAMINESTVLPSDALAKNSISYFHGDCKLITNEFYNK